MSYQVLQQIRREVAAGAVTESALGELSIFKYSADCVWDGMWNDVVKRCRGIVLNTATGKIVARPFDKFFNINERPDTNVHLLEKKAKSQKMVATKKLDGSMCSIWFYNGAWHCSTPGGLTSPQAQHAAGLLLGKYNLSKLPTDITFVCELLCPWDRKDKVVDYGDRDELVLLAAFENKWDLTEVPRQRLETLATGTGLQLVDVYPLDEEDPWSTPIPVGEEGFVVRFEDGFRIKIKSRWYMHWHRLLSQVSYKHLIELLEGGGDPKTVLSKDAPPHAKAALDDILSHILTLKENIEREVDEWWLKAEDTTDFKACAELFRQAGSIQHLLFARMREHEIGYQKGLYKLIRLQVKEEQ